MHSGTRRLFFLLTLFVFAWLAAKLVLPLLAPFLVGTVLALAAEPVVCLLRRRARIPRSLGSVVGVLLAFGILASLALMLCAFLVRELRSLAGVLPDLEEAARSGIGLMERWLLGLTDKAPESLRPLLRNNVSAMFSDGTSLLTRITGWLLGLAGSILGHIPDSALGLGTALISGCMISAKLPRIRRWLLARISRQRLRKLAELWQRIKGTLLGYLAAQGKLMGVTFVLLCLGLVILKVPHAPVWAAGICLVDALPVLGTGAVLLPWTLLYLLQGDTPRALGLLGIYVTISVTRSVLEPRFLGKHLGLDPLVTLIAMYSGYKLWGIAGMLFAPLLAVVAVQAVPKQAG